MPVEILYSEQTVPIVADRDSVMKSMARYVDQLFARTERATERVKDRIADRIADRITDSLARRSTSIVVLSTQEYEEYQATLDVLHDPEALDALRRADQQPDDEARPYEDIKRELSI